ncbi:uncharacterized protein LOC115369115 [Myripristis murdjan]|uniref:uncharacterized protein LOC115369115 n=1 Tax=Myripristis murdjan TaxID=586833 RepID=UPI0011762D49|nr:uncharacterized protein LOC115369115 [Myripristis murdjan]
MKVSRVLQLSILLVGLCLARHTPSPATHSSTQEAGQVPMSHVKMLSLGLGHLLQGVEENSGRVGRQVEQVTTELDGAAKTLENLHKQGVQAGRTHRQVRKDLQMLSAKGDRLERVVQDLQRGLRDLVAEQGAMELRMSQILQRVMSVSEPASGSQTQLNMSLMKVIVDKQARRLASLASEVTARERMIDRRLQHIEHLEKQVSSIRGGKASQQG